MGMRVCVGSIRFVRAVYRIEEEAMTADQLREALYDEETILRKFNATYTCDPEEGTIRRIRPFGKRFPAGSLAGNLNRTPGKEYLAICIGGHFYLAHRVIWLYVHGKWPSKHIDHINGDRLDNRISNLRECSVSENAMNRKRSITNKSGFKGVHFHKASNSWCVEVQKNRKQHKVHGFINSEIAADFASMLRCLLHGEFARDQ